MLQRRLVNVLFRPIRQVPHHHTLPLYRRQQQFSVTARSQAESEDIGAFAAAFRKTEIFKKLAGHPEAIAAFEDFARILQNAGVDMTAGKPPSTMKMARLAMNPDFRNGLQRVTEELKKAGIDMSSPETMNELMSLKKAAEIPK